MSRYILIYLNFSKYICHRIIHIWIQVHRSSCQHDLWYGCERECSQRENVSIGRFDVSTSEFHLGKPAKTEAFFWTFLNRWYLSHLPLGKIQFCGCVLITIEPIWSIPHISHFFHNRILGQEIFPLKITQEDLSTLVLFALTVKKFPSQVILEKIFNHLWSSRWCLIWGMYQVW